MEIRKGVDKKKKEKYKKNKKKIKIQCDENKKWCRQ